MTAVKSAMLALGMPHCAASSFQYSLNFVDCFSGACIIVLIETKGIYVLNFLLPSSQESDFVLGQRIIDP